MMTEWGASPLLWLKLESFQLGPPWKWKDHCANGHHSVNGPLCQWTPLFQWTTLPMDTRPLYQWTTLPMDTRPGTGQTTRPIRNLMVHMVHSSLALATSQANYPQVTSHAEAPGLRLLHPPLCACHHQCTMCTMCMHECGPKFTPIWCRQTVQNLCLPKGAREQNRVNTLKQLCLYPG